MAWIYIISYLHFQASMNELLWSLLAQGSQRCVPGAVAVCKLETQKIFYFPLVHINRKVGTTLVAQ